MMHRTILIAVIGALGASRIAHGELIDVDFKSSTYFNPTYTGGAVLGGAGDLWNAAYAGNTDPFSSTYGPQSLFDSQGNATSAQVTFSCVGGVIPLNGPLQPDPGMTHDYLYNNVGGSITVGITGLAASQAYDLVLYVASDDASDGSRALTGNANGVGFAATGNALPGFVNGENYVELTVLSDSNGTLNISEDNPGNAHREVDLGGLQLSGRVLTPEPFTTSLGIAAAGLFIRRKTNARRT